MVMYSVSIGDADRDLDLLFGEPSALPLGERRRGEPEGDRPAGERPRDLERERDREALREPIAACL